MVAPGAPAIPPVFVLSTGRCGSTMVSDILNLHPDVLSLSEFFSFIGMGSFRRPRVTGARMWRLCSEQQNRTRLMLRGEFEEFVYPLDTPGARFTKADVPPILCATLPHITDEYYDLYEELAPVVRDRPRQPPAAHFRRLFEWLCARFGRSVWVERSGGSLLFGAKLLREFPDARIIHVYRDGRETAISMSRHYLFRMIVATMHALKSWGIDAMASMSGGRFWDRISPWLELFTSALLNPDKLPYDKLTLADFGIFWSGMISRGEQMFGHFPPDRLLNLRFEDVQADPEPQIRRLIRFIDPSLENEAWLRKAAAVPRPTPSKFARLSAADQAALNAACRPGLELLGYPL